MNPYAGLCSPSCSSTSNIFLQSTHISQQLPPPRQLTEIASVIYGTGRCHCAPFYLKLQYVGITMETAENCPNYCQRARIQKYDTSTVFVVEACGSRLSTTLCFDRFSSMRSKTNAPQFCCCVFLWLYNKSPCFFFNKELSDKSYCGLMICLLQVMKCSSYPGAAVFYSVLNSRVNALTTSVRKWELKKLKSLSCDFLLCAV